MTSSFNDQIYQSQSKAVHNNGLNKALRKRSQLYKKYLKLGTSESKQLLLSSTIILPIFYKKNANCNTQIDKENITDNLFCHTVKLVTSHKIKGNSRVFLWKTLLYLMINMRHFK